MPETSSERTHGRYGVQKLVERMVRRMPALNDHEAAWLLAAIAARTDDDPERLISAIRARRDRQLAAQQSCYTTVESERPKRDAKLAAHLHSPLRLVNVTRMPSTSDRPAPNSKLWSDASYRVRGLHVYVRGVERGQRFLTDDEVATLAAVVAKCEQAKREQAKTSNTP